jgi:hypothetical protein
VISISDLLKNARVPLYEHQRVGVQKLVDNDYFFLTDEMGAGKTCQVINAAQVLFFEGIIDTVLVVAPASVRAVWFDPELGELAKHLWYETPAEIIEYHKKIRRWLHGNQTEYEGSKVRAKPQLRWVITNYDYFRSSKERIEQLKKSVCGGKTLLVLDESSAVKNFRADQTKACLALRQVCGRVILLNGTPIANSPLDLYAQGRILNPTILNCSTFFHFRAKYAVMGGFKQRQVIGWQNLDDLQKRFAPYVLRRLKSECLDLPPKLPPVAITATLTESTWSMYKEMRDELIAWLDQQTVSIAPQAIVKTLRLAQLCSGFLGGAVHQEIDLDDLDAPIKNTPVRFEYLPPREVGNEKLDVFLEWITERLLEDPNHKLLVWCRFRPELQRLYTHLEGLSADLRLRTDLRLGRILGGQKREEREHALRLLDPRTAPEKSSVVVVGTPASGSMGLNLHAATTVVYISNDYNLKTRLQSEDRAHRPGQTRPVSYFDVIATGPRGQKTIDHTIIKMLRNKEEVARLTTEGWRRILIDESLENS